MKLASSIPKIEVNGQEYFFYEGKTVNKRFGWFIVLLEMMKRGYKLRIHYSYNDVRDKPNKFSMEAKNCIAPVMPRRVEVFKEEIERVDDNLDSVFGERYRKNLVKAGDILDVKGLDPSPSESLDLIGMVV